MHDVSWTGAPVILVLPRSKAGRKILLAKVMILVGVFLLLSAVLEPANVLRTVVGAAVLLVGGVMIGILGWREATIQDH